MPDGAADRDPRGRSRRSDPRQVACDALLGKERGRLDLDGGSLARLVGAPRRQAHDLILGVSRHLFLIDAVLRRFLKRPPRLLVPQAKEALRIGIYELLWNDRTPVPVVVAGAVDLMKGSRPLRGLENAVQRRVAEGYIRTSEPEALEDRRTLWLGPGRGVRFERPILPDPSVDETKALGVLYTLPEAFVDGMRAALPLEHEAFFRASSTNLPLALRPRPGTDLEELRLGVEGSGGTWFGPRGGIVCVHLATAPEAFPPLQDGRVVVQDLVAAEVAPFVDPQPGDRVLDLCAAPGGKSAHLADLLRGKGMVVAAHRGLRSAARLADNVSRLAPAIRLHDLGQDGHALPSGPFDRVLVDAPCSNSGVLMKRVEARLRLHPDNLSGLEALQLNLLERGASLLRDGGVLVYATCSVLEGENHGLVRRFLQRIPGFSLDEERLRYPHRTGRDGDYMARLRRRG
jgi:16S rRNA (cytosine967-C5)-methyltransferase